MGGQQRLDTHRQPEGSIWRRSSSVNATYVAALTEFLGKLLDDSECVLSSAAVCETIGEGHILTAEGD